MTSFRFLSNALKMIASRYIQILYVTTIETVCFQQVAKYDCLREAHTHTLARSFFLSEHTLTHTLLLTLVLKVYSKATLGGWSMAQWFRACTEDWRTGGLEYRSILGISQLPVGALTLLTSAGTWTPPAQRYI